MKLASVISAAVIVIAVIGLVLGLLAFGVESDRIPLLITAVAAVVGPTLVSLLALAKSDQVHQELNNGTLKANVKDAITEHAEETGNG